ncbi:MAG: 30S ribosomal protein S4 [bacterium]|nr:30S ribosomal protein S4 [bacterium]
MGRYIGPVCKICRREGMKLFLKGARCASEKCGLVRRNYPPGQKGGDRGQKKLSDYGQQLREKQKAKYIYGIYERQFRNYFRKAKRMKGITGENLLQFLERRLDNVIFKLGWTASRRLARQWVCHGHILVNNRKVDIPSYLVKPNDRISVRREKMMKKIMETTGGEIPPWLELDREKNLARVLRFPNRDEISLPIDEQLVVTLYSK